MGTTAPQEREEKFALRHRKTAPSIPQQQESAGQDTPRKERGRRESISFRGPVPRPDSRVSKSQPSRNTGILFDTCDLLFEEGRKVAGLGRDGRDKYSVIWIKRDPSLERSVRGHIFAEVFDDSTKETLTLTLHMNELEELFALVGMQPVSDEERWAWVAHQLFVRKAEKWAEVDRELVLKGHERVGKALEPLPKPRSEAEELNSQFRDIFATRMADMSAKDKCEQLFGEAASGFGDNEEGAKRARKEAEIVFLSRKFNIYRPLVDELRHWYDKLDESGDGKIDKKEFRVMVDWVCGKSNRSAPTDATFNRLWNEFHGRNEGLVDFAEFLDWILMKYPALKDMTLGQMRKFTHIQKDKKLTKDAKQPTKELTQEGAPS